jgi:5-formyltetrahydrofolate cyclo-ligase
MPSTYNSSSLENSKDKQRKAAWNILKQMEGRQRATAAKAAAVNLKDNVYWGKARCLLAYLYFGAELDVDPIIESALTDGKDVYVPKLTGELMSFHRVSSLETQFDKGVFGIREPSGDAPTWAPSPGPVLVLVPGLAFDENGARLGRGKGYYDRFISRIRLEASEMGEPPPLCIGLAYKEQIITSVPTGENDALLDGLITDGFSGLF